MNKLITIEDVVRTVFNRNVDINLLKPSMLTIAEVNFIQHYLGDLYDDIIFDESGDYNDFVEEYIKPVISWGVLYNNFEYISLNITDKGLLQMVIEGTANLIGRDARYDAKMEIKKNLVTLIKKMRLKAEYEKDNNNLLYKNYNSEYIPSIMVFVEGNQRYNIRPF